MTLTARKTELLEQVYKITSSVSHPSNTYPTHEWAEEAKAIDEVRDVAVMESLVRDGLIRRHGGVSGTAQLVNITKDGITALWNEYDARLDAMLEGAL